MKRADIEVGKAYAVRSTGSGCVQRMAVLGITHVYVGCSGRRAPAVVLDGSTTPQVLTQVLMPWEAWEAEERERKARDAAVQAERQRHDFAAWKAVHAKLADAQIDPVCVDGEKRTITLRWEDLARILVKS